LEQPPATTAQTPPAPGAQAPPGTTAQSPLAGQPGVETARPGEPPAGPPGFAARGRLRRRARFLRKARELAYRDLGGLVFNLHRFGQRNDDLVLAKLTTLEQIDRELRALEASLEERQDVTVLREAGVTACPRCAAIHSSQDRFCPTCGLSVSRHTNLPISGPVGGADASQPATPAAGASDGSPASAPQPAPAPATPAAAGPSSTPSPASASPSPPAGRRPERVSPPGDAPPSAPSGESTHTRAPVPDFTAQRSPGAQPERAPGPGRQGEEQPTKIIRPPAGGA
jgi:hypothetical protein